MHFDISRDSFDEKSHFPRVPLEQGRVLLDADLNEQSSILKYRLHRLARDLFGDSWGPAGSDLGFAMALIDAKYSIGKGRYYVAGRLIENDRETTDHFAQYDFPLDKDHSPLPAAPFVFYLDVWEREVTDVILPEIKDPALASLGTVFRSRLVWQVRAALLSDVFPSPPAGNQNFPKPDDLFLTEVADAPKRLGALRVLRDALPAKFKVDRAVGLAARPVLPKDDPAALDADRQYRGLENQLYRVEIHRTGTAFVPTSGKLDPKVSYATFKWSRDNGTAEFPIKKWNVNKTSVTVELLHVGPDERSTLHLHEWVDFIDDNTVLNPRDDSSPSGFKVPALFEVTGIDPCEPTHITLEGSTESAQNSAASVALNPDRPNSPFLRRWDHQPARSAAQDFDAAGAEPILADDNSFLVVAGDDIWLDLEDGVQVSFGTEGGAKFQRGDYWLIPARQATGQVLWPKDVVDGQTVPRPLPPRMTAHYFAPLAAVKADGTTIDCRFQVDLSKTLVPVS